MSKKKTMTPEKLSQLSVHPAAALVPEMAEDEYAAFKQNVGEHGVIVPIEVCGDQLVDGRHRRRAAMELNRECPVNEVTSDAIDAIVALNVMRRHLSTKQRAQVAADIATAKVGRPKEIGPNGPISHPKTLKEASKLLNISERSIKRAKAEKARTRESARAPVLDVEDEHVAPGNDFGARCLDWLRKLRDQEFYGADVDDVVESLDDRDASQLHAHAAHAARWATGVVAACAARSKEAKVC